MSAVLVSASDEGSSAGGMSDTMLAYWRTFGSTYKLVQVRESLESTQLPGIENPRIHRRHPDVSANRSFCPREQWPSIPSHPIPTDRPLCLRRRAALSRSLEQRSAGRSQRPPARDRLGTVRSTHDRAPHAPLQASDFHSASIRRARRKSDPNRHSASRMACAARRGSGACTREWCMYSVIVSRARTML